MDTYKERKKSLVMQLLLNLGKIKGKTRLMKYTFLLEQEENIEKTFYFQPKHYGPYSKDLEDTLKELERLKLIDNYYDRDKKTQIIEINSAGYDFIKNNDSNIAISEKITNTILDLENFTLKELINYVYSKYPEYTFFSKIKNK